MKLTYTLITTALAGIFSTSVLAADFNLKIQSSDPSGDKNFQVQQKWAKRVGIMTDGRIKITLLPTGSVVKNTETLDAIRQGILDGQVTATEYFSGKDPALV